MKILSTYKDYYDYLSGVWGEDPLLILDRRNFKTVGAFKLKSWPPYLNRLWIGGYCVEFCIGGGSTYFGERILDCFEDAKVWRGREIPTYRKVSMERNYKMKWEELLRYKPCLIENPYGRLSSFLEVVLEPLPRRRSEFLPPEVVIGVDVSRRDQDFDFEYPILKDLGVNRFISPETAYTWIVEYLSKQRTQQESSVDSRTDRQKLEGRGFDSRTSFRPKIKEVKNENRR